MSLECQCESRVSITQSLCFQVRDVHDERPVQPGRVRYPERVVPPGGEYPGPERRGGVPGVLQRGPEGERLQPAQCVGARELWGTRPRETPRGSQLVLHQRDCG